MSWVVAHELLLGVAQGQWPPCWGGAQACRLLHRTGLGTGQRLPFHLIHSERAERPVRALRRFCPTWRRRRGYGSSYYGVTEGLGTPSMEFPVDGIPVFERAQWCPGHWMLQEDHWQPKVFFLHLRNSIQHPSRKTLPVLREAVVWDKSVCDPSFPPTPPHMLPIYEHPDFRPSLWTRSSELHFTDGETEAACHQGPFPLRSPFLDLG